jgi:glycosyltransferase involved in cell wall biosynthesis
MQLCTGVSAGNRFLAEAAREANPRLQIQVVPTCVEVQRYSLAEHLDGSSTLVWIGSASTLQGLERIRPLLESLGEALPELKLKLICNRFLKLNCLEVIESPWSEATETLELASSDIGISWIPDDPWSRGKCGLKVLQYMAAGLPVVANRVGVHPEMIQHGVSGFLAESPEEWLEAIRLLARDPELRRKMGQAGRQIVEERYSIEAGTQAWATIFVTLAGKMRRTA